MSVLTNATLCPVRLVALLCLVAALGGCSSHHGHTATPTSTSTSTKKTTVSVEVELRGHDRALDHSRDALCPAAIHAWDDQGYGWTGDEIATGVMESGPASDAVKTTWVICRGESSGGVGVIAARATDGQHWLTRELPIPPNNHPGDDVSVDFANFGRVYLTYDSLVGTQYRHVFTTDNGGRWTVFADPPLSSYELDGRL
jgi:hypothetical protein